MLDRIIHAAVISGLSLAMVSCNRENDRPMTPANGPADAASEPGYPDTTTQDPTGHSSMGTGPGTANPGTTTSGPGSTGSGSGSGTTGSGSGSNPAGSGSGAPTTGSGSGATGGSVR
jgi:hypothetical protein